MKKVTAVLLAFCVFFTVSIAPNGMASSVEDPYMLEYAMLAEPTQQELIEQQVYDQLNNTLKGDYLIDVQAFYESKEAIEEGLYNSKESEYFGFLLSEVDAEFEETPYVFTVDENGESIVKEFVPYEDVWGKVLTNVAIGGGVILVCVTVSAVTAGGATPALHLIFSCAADTAVKFSLKSAAVTVVASTVKNYITTGDIKESLKNAAVDGSEAFKWGAIGGAVTGAAAQSIHLAKLKRATDMPMNDIAEMLMAGKFSDITLKNIHSKQEFDIYQDANLVEYELDGRRFLIPADMNWDFIDPTTGMSNRQLIKNGYNPVDVNGVKYEWHHVGQKKNSPLALLTNEQHHANTAILHPQKVSEVRPNGDTTFWETDKKNALEVFSRLLEIIL